MMYVPIDGGKCMVYEYKEKDDKVKAHFKVLASYAYYSTEKSVRQNYLDENYSGGTFEFGIAGEVDLERIMKGFSAELGIMYSKYKSEHFIPTSRMPINAEAYSTMEKSILMVSYYRNTPTWVFYFTDTIVTLRNLIKERRHQDLTSNSAKSHFSISFKDDVPHIECHLCEFFLFL